MVDSIPLRLSYPNLYAFSNSITFFLGCTLSWHFSFYFHWKFRKWETWAIWNNSGSIAAFSFWTQGNRYYLANKCKRDEEKILTVKGSSRSFILIVSQHSEANKLCKETYGSSLCKWPIKGSYFLIRFWCQEVGKNYSHIDHLDTMQTVLNSKPS